MNPKYGSWKIWCGWAGAGLGIPFLALMRIHEGKLPMTESSLWHLASLIVLIIGTAKLIRKDRYGWLWLAGFFYGNAFDHRGIAAWAYVILAGVFVATWRQWKKP